LAIDPTALRPLLGEARKF